MNKELQAEAQKLVDRRMPDIVVPPANDPHVNLDDTRAVSTAVKRWEKAQHTRQAIVVWLTSKFHVSETIASRAVSRATIARNTRLYRQRAAQ